MTLVTWFPAQEIALKNHTSGSPVDTVSGRAKRAREPGVGCEKASVLPHDHTGKYHNPDFLTLMLKT